jgi:hypothetical protein
LTILDIEEQPSNNSRFLKPKKENKTEVDPIFREKSKRVRAAWNRAYLAYDGIDFVTRQEEFKQSLHLEVLEGMDPNLQVTTLLRVIRVLFPSGTSLFENENGEVDPKVRSALVYTIISRLQSEDSLKAGVKDSTVDISGTSAGKVGFVIGKYKCPIPQLTFDSKHNIINSKVDFYETRYWCRDDPKEIQKVFSKWGKCSDLSVAICDKRGNFDNVYKVPNESEWMNSSIESLVAANSKNLLSNRVGGVRNYLAYKQIEDKMIESGSASESELSKITREDIMSILQQKKRRKI